MTAHLKFTLLGTGSSGGVPRIGNDWGACDPDEPRNRRSRCCAMVERFTEVDAEPTRVLIDTSPDIRSQLLAQNVGRIDGVIYTHEHADQVGGIDELRVLAIRQRARIPIHMEPRTAAALKMRAGYCFEGVGGYPSILDEQPYMEPLKELVINGPGGEIAFLPIEQEHGFITSLGFRIGGLAYCNDLNAFPQESLAALDGVEVFIVDALRYTAHPSHANLDQALAWAQEIGARRTILTNMHVDLDYQTLCRELPEGVEPGFDGLALELPV